MDEADRTDRDRLEDAQDAQDAQDALVGLLGWLAALDDRARALGADPEAEVIAPDRAVANAFQIGVFPETGPFLAYPGALWWFGGAWRAAAAGPAGIALVADYPRAFALLLPGDWPRAFAEFARLCAGRGSLALYPYAERYAAGWDALAARPVAVAGVADFDAARGVSLPFPSEFPSEAFPWLDPVLRSPLPV
jgi:hypothetical protein